jgi:hypothetical protein
LKDNDGQLSTKRLWQCILEGIADDIIGQWPEFSDKINEMTDFRVSGMETLERMAKYLFIVKTDPAKKDHDERDRKKDYAMFVNNSPKFKKVSNFCFEVYKVSSTDEIENIVDSFIKKFEDYDEFKQLVEYILIH